ncbi:MAG: TetR/AcrR family transcriptional regulator [Bacteroidia bacterium]|nr:TetR/AcrR family transcriptional regulator [Bacteroidia bacterium]
MEVKGKTDRKTQVIEAAEALFSDKGFLATSMRDLAEALELEAASLYTHISSKDELLFLIADRCANEFFEAINPIYKSNLNTEAKLTAMIVAHMEVIARNLPASAVFFNEWKHLAEPRKSEYAQRRDDYEAIFRSVVRKGFEENLFYNYDEGFSTRTILAALNWTHTWYKPDGELKPEEIGERLAKILLTGLIRNM